MRDEGGVRNVDSSRVKGIDRVQYVTSNDDTVYLRVFN